MANSALISAHIVDKVRRASRLKPAIAGPPNSTFIVSCEPHRPAIYRKTSLATTPWGRDPCSSYRTVAPTRNHVLPVQRTYKSSVPPVPRAQQLSAPPLNV